VTLLNRTDTALMKFLIVGIAILYLPFSQDEFRGFREVLFQIVMLWLMLSFFSKLFLDFKKSSLFVRDSNTLLLWFLALSASLAFFISLAFVSPTTLQLFTAINFSLGFFLFFFFVDVFRSGDLKGWVNLFLAVATINAVYGIFQYFGFDPFFESLDAKFHAEHPKYLVAGFLDSGNIFAPFVASFLPLLFTTFIVGEQMRESIFLLITSSLLLCAVALTQNIAGIISLALPMLFILSFFSFKSWRQEKRVPVKFLICWVVFLIVLLVSIFAVSRMSDDIKVMKKWSIEERETQNSAAIMMFSESPLLGKGPGFFYRHFTDYRRAVWFNAPRERRPDRVAYQTHNDYLQLLAEGGVLTFIPVFLFVVYLFYLCGIRVKSIFGKKKFADNEILLIGSAGGFSVFLINGLASFPFHSLSLSVVAIFWAAILFTCSSEVLSE